MIDTNVLKVLLGRISDRTQTLADKEGISEGRRAGAGLLEAKLRLGVLKMLGDLGVELDNEAEAREWMKAQERGVNAAGQEALAKQLQKVAESLGATPEDLKAGRSRKEKRERERRKANGDCVKCPKGKVTRAVEGSTMCEECGTAHNRRNRAYRVRKKLQEGESERSPVDVGNASAADNEAVPTTMQQTDGAAASAQTPSAKPPVDSSASTHQGGPQQSDTGARLPFLTRIKQ